MKREIKFRAWDVVDKRMILPDIWMSRLCGEGVSLEEILGNEEYAVMQFTGLKDKNGKEIYEGDVVRAWKDSQQDTSEPLGVIEYGDFNAVYYICFETRPENLMVMACDYDQLEIIGNIYENPELLNPPTK